MRPALSALAIAASMSGCSVFVHDEILPTGRTRAIAASGREIARLKRSSLDVRANGTAVLAFDGSRIAACTSEREVQARHSRTVSLADVAIGAGLIGVGVWAGKTQCKSGATVGDNPLCLAAVGILGGVSLMLFSGLNLLVPDSGDPEWRSTDEFAPCDGATARPFDTIALVRNGRRELLQGPDGRFTAALPLDELERTQIDVGIAHFAIPQIVPEAAELERSRPAKLAAMLTVEDDNHDRVLDAREGAQLSVEVTNTGIGVAYASLSIVLDDPEVTVDRADDGVIRIAPGAHHVFRRHLVASAAVRDGTLRGRVVVHDARGGGSEPQLITLAMRRERLPRLRLVGMQIDDHPQSNKTATGNGNGIAEPNEIVQVILTFKNVGEATARDVRVVLRSDREAAVNVTGTGVLALGSIEPEHRAQTQFVVLIRASATGKHLSTTIFVGNEVGIPISLDIEVGKPVQELLPEEDNATGPRVAVPR